MVLAGFCLDRAFNRIINNGGSNQWIKGHGLSTVVKDLPLHSCEEQPSSRRVINVNKWFCVENYSFSRVVCAWQWISGCSGRVELNTSSTVLKFADPLPAAFVAVWPTAKFLKHFAFGCLGHSRAYFFDLMVTHLLIGTAETTPTDLLAFSTAFPNSIPGLETGFLRAARTSFKWPPAYYKELRHENRMPTQS